MRLLWWRRRPNVEASDVNQKLREALDASAAARAQLVTTEHKVRWANAIAATASEIGRRNGFYEMLAETFQLKE